MKAYLNIFLSPILCVLVYSIFTYYDSFEYYPIFFGLIIGFLNWESHRFNPFYGVFLCALLAFLSFIVSYFSLSIYDYLREFLLNNTDSVISDDAMREVGFIISPFVLAPFLVFLSFLFVFNIKKTKRVLLIIISSIVLLILTALILYNIEVGDPYLFWQLIVALTVQLMINEKPLREGDNL